MLDRGDGSGEVEGGGLGEGGLMRAFPQCLGLVTGAHLVLVESDRPLLPTRGSL